MIPTTPQFKSPNAIGLNVSYQRLAPFFDSEVPARQELNAEYAMVLAAEDDVQWLAHLDSDELLYLNSPLSLFDHIRIFEENNLGCVTFKNYEAVPENNVKIGDIFCNVTLFKKHISDIEVTAQAMKSVDFWKSKTNHQQYMISYDNGKCMAKVVKGTAMRGVHQWISGNPDLRTATCVADPRHLNPEQLFKCDVIILHFVVSGLYWYLKKYKALDAFPNYWYGGQLKIPPCFHLDSRDRFLSGNFERMKDAYLKEVVLTDTDGQLASSLISSGTCCRIEGIREAILQQHRLFWSKEYSVVDSIETSPDIISRQGSGVPDDSEGSTVNSLPFEKMWILSSLVSKYITPDK